MSKKRPYRSIIRRSCSLLTMSYHRGVAEGRWTNQAGALEALGVSQAELSTALQLSELPAEIVALFESEVDITSHTVRVIRETIARDGLTKVRQRIRQQAAGAKLTRRAALMLIKGRTSDSKRALRWSGQDEERIVNRPLDLPKNISDRYHLGVTQGEWNSYSECARVLNLSRRNISDAVAIRELPDCIRHLFDERSLSFAVGRRLLAMRKDMGVDEMIERARRIDDMFQTGGRIASNVLQELNEPYIRPSVYSRVRIKKGRGSNRLIIECKDAAFLMQYRREIELAISRVLKKRMKDEDLIRFAAEGFGGLRPGLKNALGLPADYTLP